MYAELALAEWDMSTDVEAEVVLEVDTEEDRLVSNDEARLGSMAEGVVVVVEAEYSDLGERKEGEEERVFGEMFVLGLSLGL